MTKENILIATLELASEKGLSNVSLSMIANRVNIRKASLFSHYKSKDEIIESMYYYFRDKALEKDKNTSFDFDSLIKNKSLEEILLILVDNYNSMNNDEHLLMFYKVVMAERVYNPLATKIMIYETEKMIKMTSILFSKLNEKGISNFIDVESSSIMFAHATHSLLDYCRDLSTFNDNNGYRNVKLFIHEFAQLYKK